MLEKINVPADLRQLEISELEELAQDIRDTLIEMTSRVGGHLGSNLGVVELTIALHYVFDSPTDKIIFDVSHQSYVHKMLTGRKRAFVDEEYYHSVSGYTNPLESEHDFFNVGHTSTSISLACGLAKGRDLRQGKENIIAVIGDASLDGGEAFEALNCASELNSGLIVVVNDNNMSIPENHGALCKHLNDLRNSQGMQKNNFFETLGFEYLFVRDGHSISDLISAFQTIKGASKPVVVHCCTVKGKGYRFSELEQEKWHWAHPFCIEDGQFNKKTAVPTENYGSIVGEYLIEKIHKDNSVIAMTASVPAYIGFNEKRRLEVGNQYFDVGIAEQNLMTMAAAITQNGGKPVVVTGSSFYQRAYDQIEQEMSINKCPVTMLIAFSGINGHDSDAHAGLFDIALLCNIPNLIYLAPSNKEDYISMLEWSIEQQENPVAIRIPWNGVHHIEKSEIKDFSKTKYKIVKHGEKVAIMGFGSFFQIGEATSELLKEKFGIEATVIDPMFATGYDVDVLEWIKEKHSIVVTIEDGIVHGGFGAKIAQYYSMDSMKVLNCGFSLSIPTVFSAEKMMEDNQLTPEQIAEKINDCLKE